MAATEGAATLPPESGPRQQLVYASRPRSIMPEPTEESQKQTETSSFEEAGTDPMRSDNAHKAPSAAESYFEQYRDDKLPSLEDHNGVSPTKEGEEGKSSIESPNKENLSFSGDAEKQEDSSSSSIAFEDKNTSSSTHLVVPLTTPSPGSSGEDYAPSKERKSASARSLDAQLRIHAPKQKMATPATPETLEFPAQPVEQHQIKEERAEPSARSTPATEPSENSSTDNSNNKNSNFEVSSDLAFPPPQQKPIFPRHEELALKLIEEDDSKLPLRSAEATAALARIRAAQDRRRHLYDRAISRQDQKYGNAGGNSGVESSPAFPAGAALKKDNVNGKLTAYLRNGKLTAPAANDDEESTPSLDSSKDTSHPMSPTSISQRDRNNNNEDVATQSDDPSSYKSWLVTEAGKFAEVHAEDAEPAVIPQGMTIQALHERATAANRAAAASASAANRAATAAALAAQASDTAVHLAQKAALAAARAQNALDLRSSDAIEQAYMAACEAEEAAEAAAREAAVSYAKAVVGEHDANKHADVAIRAGNLSRPHGIIAQSSAVFRQVRRNTVNAAGKTRDGVVAGKNAIVEAAVVSRNKAVAAGHAVVDGAKNAYNAVEEKIRSIGK